MYGSMGGARKLILPLPYLFGWWYDIKINRHNGRINMSQMIYLADDRNVVAKFVNGKSVPRDKDGDETAILGGNQ